MRSNGLALLLIILTSTYKTISEETDCKAKGFKCSSLYKFVLCIDFFGDGLTEIIDSNLLSCPKGSTCDNNNNLHCEITSLTKVVHPTYEAIFNARNLKTTSVPTSTHKPKVTKKKPTSKSTTTVEPHIVYKTTLHVSNVQPTRDKTRTNTSPATHSSNCPKTQPFADPNDCRIFYICFGEKPIKFFCPLNTFFNPSGKRCVLDKSLCKMTTLQPACPYEYPFGDAHDCTVFYICLGKSPLKLVCPQQSVFSRILKKCTYDVKHCTIKTTIDFSTVKTPTHRIKSTTSPPKSKLNVIKTTSKIHKTTPKINKTTPKIKLKTNQATHKTTPIKSKLTTPIPKKMHSFSTTTPRKIPFQITSTKDRKPTRITNKNPIEGTRNVNFETNYKTKIVPKISTKRIPKTTKKTTPRTTTTKTYITTTESDPDTTIKEKIIPKITVKRIPKTIFKTFNTTPKTIDKLLTPKYHRVDTRTDYTKCPSLEPFGDPHNCNIFYFCSGSIVNKVFCPEGTIFSTKTKFCTFDRKQCRENKNTDKI